MYGVGGNVSECTVKSSTDLSFDAWRGASWAWEARGNDYLRSTHRNVQYSLGQCNNLGFRLVLSQSSEQPIVSPSQRELNTQLPEPSLQKAPIKEEKPQVKETVSAAEIQKSSNLSKEIEKPRSDVAPLPQLVASLSSPIPASADNPAVTEAFMRVRTKIAAEYDIKYPVWKPGQEVSVFRSGIGTRGMLVSIGETGLILSQKSKQIEIPFTEMDFKSKLQADAAFREKALDIEAKKAFSAQEGPKLLDN